MLHYGGLTYALKGLEIKREKSDLGRI